MITWTDFVTINQNDDSKQREGGSTSEVSIIVAHIAFELIVEMKSNPTIDSQVDFRLIE